MLLSRRVRGATWFYSDYNPHCVPLANSNFARAGLAGLDWRPLEGKWDLVTPPIGATAPAVDVVFGCLPQVPEEKDFSEAGMSHYYHPQLYPDSKLNSFGLGLNEALLSRARSVLSEKGEVVLNLGGRPGLPRLEAMFRAKGFAPRVVYEEVVPQHRGTSLFAFAKAEEAGEDNFEFFSDPEGRNRINGREAAARHPVPQRGYEPVFHKIYVIAGTIT
jgi:hypothetical protein